MSPCDPSMEDLRVPIMVDILSRLPLKTIIHCKCVSKKWRDIVLDPYFADIQLSISTTGFMIYHKYGILKLVEVKDELNHHNLHHSPVMSLAPTLNESGITPAGSVNGLVCLWQHVGRSIDNTYICNPITREYMILPRKQYYKEGYRRVFYCFGVGSLTRKYKVIRIFVTSTYYYPDFTRKFQLGLSEAEVYTLGTGQWRSLGHVPYRLIGVYGHFLNGHAHWTIDDHNAGERICSFNFDNEIFEVFPSPPSEATKESRYCFRRLGILKGCLCRCDTSYNTEFTVWVMKEYGVKMSWHKELVIENGICLNFSIHHVQGLKDGTILMATSQNSLVVYCPWKKAIVKTELVDGCFKYGSVYGLSFHRLQNFENESVHLL